MAFGVALDFLAGVVVADLVGRGVSRAGVLLPPNLILSFGVLEGVSWAWGAGELRVGMLRPEGILILRMGRDMLNDVTEILGVRSRCRKVGKRRSDWFRSLW